MSKSGNLLKFDTKKDKPYFLTSKAKATFNYLSLIFIKALIF